MSPESPFRKPGTCLKALSQGPVPAARPRLRVSQARLSPQLPPHAADRDRGSGKLPYGLGVEGQAEPRLACFKANGPPCRAAWKRWRGTGPGGPPNIHP